MVQTCRFGPEGEGQHVIISGAEIIGARVARAWFFAMALPQATEFSGTRRARTGSCRLQVRESVAERRQLREFRSPLSVWETESG